MMPMIIMKVRIAKATIPRSQFSPFHTRGFFAGGAARGGAAATAGAAAGAPSVFEGAADAELVATVTLYFRWKGK